MDRNAEHIKRQMLVNATEITRLMTRIRQTLADRGNSEQGREAWASACAELHRRYGELAFPGGYGDAIERILAGEAAAVDAALCFLECRPYFFRSGYMYQRILRKTKRAPLTEEQRNRLDAVLLRRAKWRALTQRANAA